MKHLRGWRVCLDELALWWWYAMKRFEHAFAQAHAVAMAVLANLATFAAAARPVAEKADRIVTRLAGNVQSVVTRRRFGFLSGIGNAALVASAGLLGLVASLPEPPYQQYPIENTVRPAVKRPLLLIGDDGKPFAKRGECVAEPVKLDELPRHLVDAVVAMEDRRFYSHIGIDPLGIARAAMRNYEAGATLEGGSTITQQLVKMSFLTSAKTFERKIEEAALAVWLELRLGKNQILERYLSSAYFGEGCFGVRAAARHFFDKPVSELSVSESALLVALLRSPTQLTQNFGDARQRSELVMQAMVRDGRLTQSELANLQPAKLNETRGSEFGGFYADWLTETLQSKMQNPHSREPLKVYSTFDPGLQQIAQDAVSSVLDKKGARSKAGQAALVAMRTDGRIVAMVGGRDRAKSQFNRAVQAQRQPGSSFKTFVYLAALRAGAQPDMLLTDEPIDINGWEPKNYGDRDHGTVTLTQAFAASINTIAVRLSEAVGRDAVITAAKDLGITSPLAPNASLPLGTSEVSLLDMTSAYAAIAAGFYPVKPWAVAGLGSNPPHEAEPPLDAGVWRLREAGTMRDLMSSVVDAGTARAAQLPVQAYGKTGTSQDYRDAWFVGFAGNLVVGVWVGNDDFTPMRGVTGGSLPAEIWHRFMKSALKSDPHFKRKLPTIAAFEARAKEPVDRSSDLASLDAIIAVDPRPREESQYGQILTRGLAERDAPWGQPYDEYDRYDSPWGRRVAPPAHVSRGFQEQLDDMGWPR